MEVEITEFAECELKKIYSYYSSVASPEIARQIKNRIINAAMRLRSLPYMGQVEQNLEEFGEGHRYLIAGNYKIIYKVHKEIVYVADIFDTRQDPEKMKRTK